MAFDESSAQDVQVTASGAEVVVAWSSAAPAGTVFQVYADGRHVWSGVSRKARLPRPRAACRYHVGSVGPGESATDFSGSLSVPPGGGNRVTLTWQGGTFLSADIAGFYVYLGTAPGGPVDYSKPAGKVAAYAQAAVTDGYGLGGYGLGGYGLASGSYSWTSGPLASGTWNVAVAPYDRFGNVGAASPASATVAGPPRPVPPGPGGGRVTYALNWSAPTGYGQGGYGAGGYGEGGSGPYATLSWLASPGL